MARERQPLWCIARVIYHGASKRTTRACLMIGSESFIGASKIACSRSCSRSQAGVTTQNMCSGVHCCDLKNGPFWAPIFFSKAVRNPSCIRSRNIRHQCRPKVAGDLSGRHSSMEDISGKSDASTTQFVRVKVVVEHDRARVQVRTLLCRTRIPSSSIASVSAL